MITVCSSHGEISIDEAGMVVEEFTSHDGELGFIEKFDLKQYAEDNNLSVDQLPDEIDILGIGYWTKDGKYEPPMKFNKMKECWEDSDELVNICNSFLE
jgi:hypothetical protein